MNIKPKELWEILYGDKDFDFDFANQLIVKNEYKTNSMFSWKIEQFDFDDEKYFIANCSTIAKRNKKSMFEIDNEKYIITKNPDYSYSILSTTRIIDEKCPINFDLVLNNQINTYSKQAYSYIVISLRKMNKDCLNIFSNYIVQYIKRFEEMISFDINDSLISRTEIKFQFKANPLSDKIFKIGLTISSLMPLIIYRLLNINNINTNLWKDENQSQKFFNIFISSNTAFENVFELKNIDILGNIATFENSIFIDENTKNEVINFGGFVSGFTKSKNSITPNVYEYKFSRIDISDYSQKIFSSKKT